MMDAKLIFDSSGAVDISILGGMVATTDGLFNVVYISLFSDRYDEEDEAGGWWADALEEEPLGSRLWKFNRSKILPETPAKIKEVCDEALVWLVKAGVAKSVTVSVYRVNLEEVRIDVEVKQPNSESKYSINWNVMEGNLNVLATYA